MRSFKCHVRIEIDNSELGVIGDFTTINALESLRLRLRDPNITNRCKISYNPLLIVVYFYNTFTKFYLNYVVWADSKLIYLGHVVAAQQIHH